MQIGLFLNNGVFEQVDDAAALRLSVESAKLAESLGYDRLWITEHHFIDFGVCSQALTLAGYLLGLTQRIRVGTAVVLAPLVHPITIAEQAAILDQVSGGRLDLGLGRGGYSLDYDVLSVPTERWSAGIEATLLAVIEALSKTGVSSNHETVSLPVGDRAAPAANAAASSDLCRDGHGRGGRSRRAAAPAAAVLLRRRHREPG